VPRLFDDLAFCSWMQMPVSCGQTCNNHRLAEFASIDGRIMIENIRWRVFKHVRSEKINSSVTSTRTIHMMMWTSDFQRSYWQTQVPRINTSPQALHRTGTDTSRDFEIAMSSWLVSLALAALASAAAGTGGFLAPKAPGRCWEIFWKTHKIWR
jgi:hypothetical protein